MGPTIPQQAGAHRHLQQIIAGLTEGVILLKPDQTLFWANEAALAMHGVGNIGELGATADEYRKAFRLTYRNKHSLSEGDYPADRVLAGEVFDEVVVEVAPSGKPEEVWVHQIRSLVLNDEDGTPELVVLVIEDKTGEYEAEERFERTFNANPAPAIICRLADLRYVKVNKGFLEMTGYPRQETIGRSVYDIDVLTDAEERESAVADLREGRTIRQREACIPMASGASKFVIVAGQPMELADEPCMLFTFIDLEPRKKVETALRHSEERFATAFKLAPVAMAVTSLDELIFLDVNEAFAALAGYSHAELLGRSPAEVELWESSAARARLRDRFKKAGSVRNHEIRLRTKEGYLLDCLVSAERVTILDKPCVLHVVQDISERKRSEGDLFNAIETVMKDTTWFSQKIIEKVADLRQPHGSNLPTSGIEDLTAREREVLALVCTGATDAAIASQFKVSRHTVRNHVTSVYEKIGVHRRGEAIVWARDRGLGVRVNAGKPSSPEKRGK